MEKVVIYLILTVGVVVYVGFGFLAVITLIIAMSGLEFGFSQLYSLLLSLAH